MRFDPAIFTAPRSETPRQVRVAGAVLLVLGLVLVLGSAPFFWLLLGIPVPPGLLPDGMRIEGTPGDGLSAFQRTALWGFSALILAVGVAALLQGLLQLCRGRKSRTLLRLILGAAVIVAVAGIIASIVAGCPLGRVCH